MAAATDYQKACSLRSPSDSVTVGEAGSLSGMLRAEQVPSAGPTEATACFLLLKAVVFLGSWPHLSTLSPLARYLLPSLIFL